jgi:quercetin dioxygenase-like cupin family protein
MKSSALAVMTICALLASSALAKGKPMQDVIWTAEAIKWEAGPVAGTKLATLWGDSKKGGNFGMLVKFDAGLMHPLHHHTHTLKLVIINGTLTHKSENGTESKLGPGSYLLQGGGNKHISGCAAGAECQFFMTSDGKFDFINDEKK